MGYSLDLIEPNQEAHSAEFTCSICFNLVDAPLLTQCQHVFCLACLQDWFETKPACPTCSSELDPRHGAGELKLASPLAWRVLGRLRVRCSLPGCTWVGEYSEVTQHMMCSDSHLATGADVSMGGTPTPGAAQPPAPAAAAAAASSDAESQRAAQAEALKAAGNSKFEQRIFGDAITLYTKAINLMPNVGTYYANRAAAYSSLGQFADAVSDCQHALRLDPTSGKVYKRLARAYGEQGDFAKMHAALQEGLSKSGGSDTALRTELDQAARLVAWEAEGSAALRNGDCSLARTFFANMLSHTSAPSIRLKLVKAELGLGLCDRALRTTRDVIKTHPNISEAYTLRGLALLFSADLDQAQKHLREALRLDPDDAEAGRAMKKVRKLERHVDAAKAASNRREFESAKEQYTEALNLVDAPPHAPLAANLHAERAAALLRLKEYDVSLKDCALAIYAQDDCKAAWLTKAQCLHGLGRHEEALREMQQLANTFQNDAQVSHAVQRASFEVRKAKRPDYYQLLSVPTISSSMEIKQAYKQQALIWHPDKHNQSDAARGAAEERFKLLGEALEILTDDFRRKLYDQGYDKAAIAERVEAANRASNNFDKDGCCGGRGCGGGGCG